MIRKSSTRNSMLMDESRVINEIIVKENQESNNNLEGNLK